MYKTTDPINNNVAVDVADPTLENKQLYQEDSLNITGTPELVYQGTLTNNSQIILEQADFDVTTLEKTTYYLVYHYKNNGNQDNQQGLTFSGTISVRIINEKMSFSDALALCDDTASNCMIENAEKSDELVYDETVDNNLRYIGADPNNYVLFNDELWRIIGVMNNIDDGTGKKETRLKIIRNESIGIYSWDNKGEYGENEWNTSALQLVLNSGAYWNRTNGECPQGINEATVTCDFSSTGLTEKAKSMISEAVWNLGGTLSNQSDGSGITSNFYDYERGTTVFDGALTKWIGSIGLMYPSDYGYATGNGTNMDRNYCLSVELYIWSNLTDCKNNNWLFDNANYQWTLTPHASSSRYIVNISFNGQAYNFSAATAHGIFPVTYLSSNVKITSGTGSSSDPYLLSL